MGVAALQGPTAGATTETAVASTPTAQGPADRSESTGTGEIVVGAIVVIAVFALATLALLFVVARRVSGDDSTADGAFDVVMGTGMPLAANESGSHHHPTTGAIATAAANDGAVRNFDDTMERKPSAHYYPIGGALDDDWDVWISGLARAPKQSES